MTLYAGVMCDECEQELEGPPDESPVVPANWFQVTVQQRTYHFCSGECVNRWVLRWGWNKERKELP